MPTAHQGHYFGLVDPDISPSSLTQSIKAGPEFIGSVRVNRTSSTYKRMFFYFVLVLLI